MANYLFVRDLVFKLDDEPSDAIIRTTFQVDETGRPIETRLQLQRLDGSVRDLFVWTEYDTKQTEN